MEVLRTDKGRGVFATQNYRKGQIVERSHVIIFPGREMGEDSVLSYYMFEWNGSKCAIALGNGSLYCHSYKPNMVYIAYPKEAMIVYQTIQAIKTGDELTINYNGDPKDKTMVSFLDKKRAVAARGK